MDYTELISLNAFEVALKKAWLEHPELRLDEPCQREDVWEILDHAFHPTIDARRSFSVEINEHVFIPPELDCAFVKHSRYMPVFWHTHEFFEMLCVLSGECDNIFEQDRFQMKAGDICIHAPGTVHCVRAFSEDVILLNILIRKSTFERAFFSLMEEECILSRFFRTAFYKTVEMPYLLFRTEKDLQIRSLILDAMTEFESDNNYKRPLLNAMLSELMIRMFQGYEESIVVPSPRVNSGRHGDVVKILRYMQENYRTVTMSELSERFNYSERQLQRIIFEASGLSFRDAIQTQKLTRAAELLRTTDLTVQLVAEQTGFQAVNNFRKLFSRQYQLTPAAYREKLRAGEGSSPETHPSVLH